MSVLGGTTLTYDEIDELVETTVFNEDELGLLYERFKYLDRANCGYLTYAEFQMIPELDANPFSPLLISYLERTSEYQRINFARFLEFLSIFSEKTEKSRRISYLFELFDLNKNSRLSKQVLARIHQTMTSEKMNVEKMNGEKMIGEKMTSEKSGSGEEEAKRVLKMYDKNKKGYLSKGDFARLYNDDEAFERNMVVDFSRRFGNDRKPGLWDIIWLPWKSMWGI